MATTATTGLRFCLLGPLEVRRDGEPLPLGGERQRGLLALLLLNANELVTTEHLAEQLFGTEASETSVRAVRVAVSRLRRLLDDATLETGPGGYLVRVDPHQLDVAEFETLVAEGRAALEHGDPAAAVAAFQAALALFRGLPLADLAPLDFLQPEIRRLEELRLSALMDRIDADLALGGGSALVPELEALVQANPFQERLRGQLMLALYRSGRQTDALEVYRHTRELLADELGLEPSRALQQLERAMLQHDPGLDDMRPRVAAEEAATCPFKGLAAFEAADAFYFCGRERLLDEIVTRLVSGTFLGIVGPSGVGKSSLLRAGVIPALAAGALPGSATWPVVLVRGGDRAAATIRDAVGACRVGDRVVIAVDQLEEVFAEDTPADERADFFAALESAAADSACRALVLVAVRADFYGGFADHPRIADRLSQSHIFVRSLDREELSRAITVPALRAGLTYEPALVDALVAETADVAGALPLLQTTLLQLWAARDGSVLRYGSYRAIGGLRGAVGRLAEEAFGRLSPEDQQLTRRILLRLAGGEEGALVRRRVPLADLQRLDGAARVLDALVAARLLTVDAELVELSHEALLHEWPRYAQWLEDDRVRRHVRGHLTASAADWDSRGRDTADLYRGARLTAALELPGVELSDLEREFLDASQAEGERELNQQRTQNRRLRLLLAGVGVFLVVAITAGVLALVSRSTARHEAQVALGRQLGAEAVSTPRIDLAMLLARESLNLDRSPQTEGTLLATLLRTPAVTGSFTVPIQDRPQDVKVSPGGHSIASVMNNAVMRVYDTRTHLQTRSFSACNAPYTYVPGSGDLLILDRKQRCIGFSVVDPRTGKTLRSLTPSHFWQWQPTSGNVLLVSPDGRYGFLVYAKVNLADGSDGPARIESWRLDRGGRSHVSGWLGGQGIVAATALPGDRIIYATDNRVITWNTRTGQPIRSVRGPTFQPNECGYCVISPNGRFLAWGDINGRVHFFDIAKGTTVDSLGAHAADVDRVAFSPDSRTLVSTGDDGVAIVWNPVTGQPLERLTGHNGRVLGADFSANGKLLYTAGLDGTILQYDLGGGRRFGSPFRLNQAGTPLGPDALQPSTPLVAVSPNGRLFAASALGGGSAPSGVELYRESPLRRVPGIVLPKGQSVGAGAWAGNRLVLGGNRGLVRFWKVTAGNARPGAVLRGLSVKSQVVAVAAAGGGRVIAAIGDYHGPPQPGQSPPTETEFALWHDGRLVTGKRLKLPQADAVALSADGKTAAVSEDVAPQGPVPIRIMDTSTGRIERTLRVPKASGAVPSLAFAPDGTLATGTYSGIVQLWNPESGQKLGQRTLVAPFPVASIAFSPDGRTFATTGSTGVSIWETATQQQLGSNLPGGDGLFGKVVYTPDGRYLLVVFTDGTAFEWPVTVNAWERQACSVAHRNFTREEWRRFVGGRSYSRVCR